LPRRDAATIAGQEVVMGKLIIFYVPVNFKSRSDKWFPPSERGKVIDFQATPNKKTA
jgi:hypothetical protein